MTLVNPQTIQCNKTKVCQNNACFWRQRDVFGRNPFLIMDDQLRKEHEEKMKNLPEPYFPKMSIIVGTNCLYVHCDGDTTNE